MVWDDVSYDQGGATASAPLMPQGHIQGYEGYETKGFDDYSKGTAAPVGYQNYDLEQPINNNYGVYEQPPVVYYWYNVGLPVGHTEKNRFMAKVLVTVFFQMMLTVIVSLPLMLTDEDSGVHRFFIDNWWIQLVAWVASLVVLIVLAIFRKKPIINLVLLTLFTLCIALAVASVVVYYSVYQVAEAFCITLCIVLSLMVFILVARVDLTMFAGLMITFAAFLLWWMIWWWAITPACFEVSCVSTSSYTYCETYNTYGVEVWGQIWAGLGVVLFSCYLIFDLTRLTHSCEVQHDEWIMAAVNIYVDIIMIFLMLLALGKNS